MRIVLTCAALAAVLNLAPTGTALADAKYKLSQQTRAVKYGAYYPVALTDYGLAGGTLLNYGGAPSVYFSSGAFFSDSDFCQTLGQSGGSDLAGVSRDPALTYTAGQCIGQTDGFIYNQNINATTAVQYPDAGATIVQGVSNTGRVGGYYRDANSVTHGFYFEGGAYTSFDPPGSTYTEVQGVGPDNVIAGSYTDTNGQSHGYLLNQAGIYTVIDYPRAEYTAIANVNSQNLVIGTAVFPGGLQQAFAWQSAKFLLPKLPTNSFSISNAVSEAGVVVGAYGSGPTTTVGGFAWQPSTGKVILVKAPTGGTAIDVRAVNSVAQIAGSYTNAANKVVGFIGTCNGTGCFQ